MGFGDVGTTSNLGGGFGTIGKKPDINTIGGLATFAASRGFEKEAEQLIKPPKLSLMQRIGRLLTSFETADALYNKLYEDKSFSAVYTGGILKDIGSGVTGKQFRAEPKKTYKDILMKEGMNDRPGKIDLVDMLGLAGDILLDPTTYLGSFIFKGITRGAKFLKTVPGIGKIASLVEKSAAGAAAPFKDLFQTGAKIKALDKAGLPGTKMWDEFVSLAKLKRAKVNDFLEEATTMASKIKKVSGKKAYMESGEVIGKAIETGVKTGDSAMDDMLDYLVSFSEKQGKELTKRKIIDDMLPNWMHHMLTPEASDLLRSGAPLTGIKKAITVTKGKHRTLKDTVENLNKWSQQKFGVDMFEKDAYKAFAVSGARSIADIENFDFLRRIGTQFGKKSADDFIDEAGIKWVKPKFPRTPIAFVKEEGSFVTMKKGLTEKALGNVRLPEPVAKEIEQITGFITNDESTKAFLKIYDKAHNFWKATVTGYFPAFHTRNAIGGIFNNWIAGVKNPLRYSQIEGILRGGKKIIDVPKLGKMTYDDFLKTMKEHGVLGQTGYLDVAEYLKKEIMPTVGQRFAHLPQKIMGVMEDRMRGALFLDRVLKGESFADAAKTVIKYHFDYLPEGFTAFEKNFMKRIIPFYTWTRHNIPLQIEQMVMQPGKYSGVFKAARYLGMEPDSEEEGILPRWLADRFMVKAQGKYWSGIGLPLEEAMEKLSAPLRGFGISMSPFLKIPIESLTGYNIFKEKSIDEDDYGKYYRNAPQFIKDWLQMKEHTGKDGTKYWTVNPRRKYWLEVVGSRGLNTALRLANGVEETESRTDLLSLITTIKSYDYSLEDLKRWSDTEKRKELEAALMRSGELAEFNRVYIR